MENNTNTRHTSNTEDNASTILGTSSDAIIEGLHKGEFAEPDDTMYPGDKDQIVNEQEQQRIVNPPENDYLEDQPISEEPVKSSLKQEDEKDVAPDPDLSEDPEIPQDKDEEDSSARKNVKN